MNSKDSKTLENLKNMVGSRICAIVEKAKAENLTVDESTNASDIAQASTSRAQNCNYLSNLTEECVSDDDSVKDPDYTDDDGENMDSNNNSYSSNYLVDNNGELEADDDEDVQLDKNLTENETETNNQIKKKRRHKKPETWKVTKRVEATLGGKEHINKSGKIVKAKAMKPPCPPCRLKCSEKIAEAVRQQIFENYWCNTKNWELKRQFVRSHITPKSVIRRRPKNHSKRPREVSISYNFDIKLDGGVKKIDVCKKFFLNTLNISETVVRNVLKNDNMGGFVAQDHRGRHEPINKTPEAVLDRVREHIKSFPCYESHYSRSKTAKKYLGPELSREKMYKLYTLKCEEDHIPNNEIVKLWLYKKIFNNDFNLAFKSVSVDTCDSCDRFMLQLKNCSEQETITLRRNYEQHLQEAESRYKMKANDKNESKKSAGKTKIIMCDLQKCLPTPCLTNNQSFYKLKLWTINFTIYDATENKSYCLIWDESEAGRGGHEIASALTKWAMTVLSQTDVEELVIWSDNCPSQNRNVMVMMSYFWLFNICPNLKVVNHKYLLRGHTHLEADQVHAIIERSVKKQPTMQIVTPWDWQQLISSVGAQVIKMDKDDFKNFEVLYSQSQSLFISKKKNADNNNFLISNVVQFQVKKDTPTIIFYKEAFEEIRPKELHVARRTATAINLPEQLPLRYQKPKGITQKKKDHLLILLQWIPSQFQEFYRNLVVTTKKVDDSDDE
ncbi:uncharacterized protein [Diabrotica undecimpunctata]|uniref:uncharacterized protein n=1 Tax=Diabrotica undecimpunctata TaxID=50387 RepID=UPI003B63A830